MRFTFKYILSLLIILQFSNCKKDEESTVLVNASVANSAEGSVSFNSGDYVAGTTVTFTATPEDGDLPQQLHLRGKIHQEHFFGMSMTILKAFYYI